VSGLELIQRLRSSKSEDAAQKIMGAFGI